MDPRTPYEDFHSARAFASNEINKIEPSSADAFMTILEFCFQYIEDVSALHSSKPKLSQRWIEVKAANFVNKRTTNAPHSTINVPDPLIGILSERYFGIKSEEIDRLLEFHKIAMAAENVTGSLLEEYVATVMEPLDWIWCTGPIIKATDFIKFPNSETEKPVLLQIKNRSNSENSSSAGIRNGTTIKKWHRLEADTGVTRWHLFPDLQGKILLSEEKFQEYVKNRIAEWKS